MKAVAVAAALVLAGLFVFAGTITAAVQLENDDAFCASCHTEPEATFYGRSLVEAADLASAHAAADPPVRCIDCHSGSGPAGRVSSLGQGAADLVAFVLNDYEQPAATTHPVGDEGCTKCHRPPTLDGLVDTDTALKSKSHYHLAEYAAAWLAADPDPRGTCVVCHVSHSEGMRASQQRSPRRAVNAACEDCHADLDDWTAAVSGQKPVKG